MDFQVAGKSYNFVNQQKYLNDFENVVPADRHEDAMECVIIMAESTEMNGEETIHTNIGMNGIPAFFEFDITDSGQGYYEIVYAGIEQFD